MNRPQVWITGPDSALIWDGVIPAPEDVDALMAAMGAPLVGPVTRALEGALAVAQAMQAEQDANRERRALRRIRPGRERRRAMKGRRG